MSVPRLRVSAEGALGVALPDPSAMPWSGAMSDAPGCPSSADRQAFADAVRKTRVAQIPDPSAGPVRDLLTALPAISAARLRAMKQAALPSPDALATAVSAHIATVHVRTPAEGEGALVQRVRRGLATVGVDTAVVGVVGRAPAEVIAHVTALATHALDSGRPCCLVFADLLSCFQQSHQPWLQPAASAALHWALVLAARLTSPGDEGRPLLRVLVTALPTAALHDEAFCACTGVLPIAGCAFVADPSLPTASTAENGDIVAAAALKAFPAGLEAAAVDPKAPSVWDTAADALAELHTALALDMDAGDEDADAPNAGRVPVVVAVVPDANAAHVLRNAALARYVAEPMKLALWAGAGAFDAAAAGMMDGPLGVADDVPLIVVAVADDIACRAASGDFIGFVSKAASDRATYLAAVVHTAVADASGAPMSMTTMHSLGNTIAATLPRTNDADTGARLIAVPPLALSARSRAGTQAADLVSVEDSEGRLWTCAKLAVDARLEHAAFGDDDDTPALAFASVVSPSECCHREIVLLAEAVIAACDGANAIGHLALGDRAHKGRFGLDLAASVLRDCVAPLPELLASSATVGSRRTSATAGEGATPFASYVVRSATLSESLLESAASADGAITHAVSPVGAVVSPTLGLWATRLFLATAATRAAPGDAILAAVARVADDRRRSVASTAMRLGGSAAATNGESLTGDAELVDALASATHTDVRHWVEQRASAPDGDEAAGQARKVDGAAMIAGHAASLWAAYPCVDVADDGNGDFGVVGAIARVLAPADSQPVVSTRCQLAVAAPRSRRTFVPPANKPAECCRGWSPVAPITLRSAGSVKILTLDEASDATRAKQKTVSIDEEGAENAAASGKPGDSSGREVATRTFPSAEAAAGHLCAVAADASFGSAIEGHVPALMLPTDASAPIVVAKTLFRTFLVNACTLGASADRAHPVALPQLPDSVCELPLWGAIVAPSRSGSVAAGVGRWVDGVAMKQLVSSARHFEAIGDTGRGLGTGDVVAEMTALDAAPASKQHRRDDGASGTVGSNGGGGNAGGTAGFVGVLPSPSERELIEKAAANILKKGRAEAEALLIKQGKAAFGFVRPEHAFHAYYLHTIARLQAASGATA